MADENLQRLRREAKFNPNDLGILTQWLNSERRAGSSLVLSLIPQKKSESLKLNYLPHVVITEEEFPTGESGLESEDFISEIKERHEYTFKVYGIKKEKRRRMEIIRYLTEQEIFNACILESSSILYLESIAPKMRTKTIVTHYHRFSTGAPAGVMANHGRDKFAYSALRLGYKTFVPEDELVELVPCLERIVNGEVIERPPLGSKWNTFNRPLKLQFETPALDDGREDEYGR